MSPSLKKKKKLDVYSEFPDHKTIFWPTYQKAFTTTI